MATYLFDCDYGQGMVEARTEQAARRAAVAEAGTYAQVRNVRRASPADLAFREAMGGSRPAR